MKPKAAPVAVCGWCRSDDDVLPVEAVVGSLCLHCRVRWGHPAGPNRPPVPPTRTQSVSDVPVDPYLIELLLAGVVPLDSGAAYNQKAAPK